MLFTLAWHGGCNVLNGRVMLPLSCVWKRDRFETLVVGKSVAILGTTYRSAVQKKTLLSKCVHLGFAVEECAMNVLLCEEVIYCRELRCTV